MGVGIGKTGALLRWMAWASEGDERGEVLWMVDVRGTRPGTLEI